MPLTYKIPYETFEKYFFNYSNNDLIFSTKVYHFFSLMRRAPFLISFILLLIVLVLTGIIFKLIAWSFAFCIFKLIKLVFGFSLSVPFKFEINDVLLPSIIFFGLLMVTVISKIIFTLEMPYLLRDLINDRTVLGKNINSKKPQPFEVNRFTILAFLKNEGDIRGMHKHIPGLSKSGSLSDAKKKLKDISINGQPILNDKEEYIAWNFELIDWDNKIEESQKKKIEKSLELLWNTYLDKEYNKIKYKR